MKLLIYFFSRCPRCSRWLILRYQLKFCRAESILAGMKGSFLFLGTGGSAGVPLIGCKCSVCTSGSEKNQRLRLSGLLRVGGKSLLIDISPDFRTQALKYKVDSID